MTYFFLACVSKFHERGKKLTKAGRRELPLKIWGQYMWGFTLSHSGAVEKCFHENLQWKEILQHVSCFLYNAISYVRTQAYGTWNSFLSLDLDLFSMQQEAFQLTVHAVLMTCVAVTWNLSQTMYEAWCGVLLCLNILTFLWLKCIDFFGRGKWVR